jgi:hypothetical protein
MYLRNTVENRPWAATRGQGSRGGHDCGAASEALRWLWWRALEMVRVVIFLSQRAGVVAARLITLHSVSAAVHRGHSAWLSCGVPNPPRTARQEVLFSSANFGRRSNRTTAPMQASLTSCFSAASLGAALTDPPAPAVE